MRSAPNYMAATESAMVRFRQQSAPKQRPMTPEREAASSAAKKKLMFDPYNKNVISLRRRAWRRARWENGV
ncbi:hypothetical protein MA16_Dca027656 [Dendrobium catenatum]|uniref:DUF4005 domain-containing protein n=1 Tax=Dendrobium catenatum TaxID=906689 RepID=A0A2I0WIW2_9ASPA|nr:hypothetical protein MA16_Dca027656 [Dendrobium catenatum]